MKYQYENSSSPWFRSIFIVNLPIMNSWIKIVQSSSIACHYYTLKFPNQPCHENILYKIQYHICAVFKKRYHICGCIELISVWGFRDSPHEKQRGLLHMKGSCKPFINYTWERLLHMNNCFPSKIQKTHKDTEKGHQFLLLQKLTDHVIVILQDFAISFLPKQMKPTYSCNFRPSLVIKHIRISVILELNNVYFSSLNNFFRPQTMVSGHNKVIHMLFRDGP